MSPASDPARSKIGLVVSCQAPVGTSLAGYADSEIRIVHAARDAGWDSIWATHHYLPDVMQLLQPAPWLARLITETGDMELGTGILILPLLNPMDVAETYGSIDVLSGGRLILGVGLGYRPEEFAAFGVDLTGRVGLLRTKLTILKELWEARAGGVSAAEPSIALTDAMVAARPVRRPRPPILIGANKEVAIRRAARIGDGWLISPFTPHAKLQAQLSMFREARAAAGLAEGQLVLGREIYCAPSDERAVEVARRYLGDKYSAYASWRGSSTTSHRDDFGSFAEGRFVLGSPETCVAALSPYVRSGIRHFKFRTRWVGMSEADAIASVRLLSDEVLPQLRRLIADQAAETAPAADLSGSRP